ncbi:helix-turn-helix domain-containing protein [Patescibacteria group bacterium]|nr:helix-turn-helix domain-containing protein [Patescibacteria group bacterium]MBU4453114.1 helix-turn-helix domain-containing protein [Patescibacteria group bacterium]MCG2687286.1 helix-turn-helix domain-containing protein [Candidatus Parcubacteria bacterium]
MRKLDCEPQTLAKKLRALRRGKAVSLKMMERETHIQKKYLEALEQGRFEDLPEPIYARNFIRAYARALGADETYFLELYEEECGACDLIGPMRSPRQRVERKKFFVWNHFLRFSGIGCLLVGVFAYIGWQVFSIIQSPKVILLSPANDSLTHEAQLNVRGIVEGEASVYVNGEPIVVDENRTFNAYVDLREGLNTLVIEAERRYSRKSVIQRSVVFDPEPWITQVSYLEQ